jgi:hypothetical protein
MMPKEFYTPDSMRRDLQPVAVPIRGASVEKSRNLIAEAKRLLKKIGVLYLTSADMDITTDVGMKFEAISRGTAP